MIIALVIFIVLALAGIGTSIWLYQQKAILQRAIVANQNTFKNEIGSVFKKEDWDLTKRVDAAFGITYGRQAFGDIKSKLSDAALLEEVRPLIGWDSPNSIEDRLSNSPAQQDQAEKYKTIRGLLGFYEEEYQRLNQRAEELSVQLETTQEKLASKSKSMNEMQNRLMQDKTEAIQKFRKKAADLRKRYKGMQGQYDNAQSTIKQWKNKFDKAQSRWNTKFQKLKKKARDWKKLYKQATAEDKVVKELRPAGSVLDVEPRYEFVVIEGGQKAGRQKGQDIVLYTRSPDGVRSVKGTAVINNVYDTTSLATITTQSAEVMQGDFFVPQTTWEQHQEGQKTTEQEPEKTVETTIEISKPEEPTKESSEKPEEPTEPSRPTDEPTEPTTEPDDRTEPEQPEEPEKPTDEEEDEGEEGGFDFQF